MSDDIPDAVEQPPWQPSDGPRPTVHTYPRRRSPALHIRIGGEWRTGTVIGRQHWPDGGFVYQVDVSVGLGYMVYRAYRWSQPGLRLLDVPAPVVVRPSSDDEPMATTMINYGLTWTDTDGAHRASAVAYDKVSGERQKQKLIAAECTAVELVEVKPGQLPTPKA